MKNLRVISNSLVALSVLVVAISFNTSPAQAFAGTLQNGDMAYAQSAFNTGEACVYLPGFTSGYDAWHFVLTSRGAVFQQSPTDPTVAINLNMVFMRPNGTLFVIKSGAWVQSGKGAYVYTLVSENDRMVMAGTVASINVVDSGMRLSHTCPGSGTAPATTPTAPTPTPSVTPSATATPTASATPTPTATRSATPTPTASASASPTPTATRSASPTPSPSTSSSPTPSATPSASPSPTPSSTRIPTLAPQPNPTASAIQVHRSRSPQPRNLLPTPTPSAQPIGSPTPTPSHSQSHSPNPNASPSPSNSPSPSTPASPAPSASPSTSRTPSPTPPAQPIVLPTPPANIDPQNIIFVEPKKPAEIPPAEIPKAPDTPIEIVTPPKYGEVTITPQGGIEYKSNLNNLKSTVVDVVTFKYTNLSGAVVVVRKEFILSQKGDVPKVIQTGYGSSGIGFNFALLALALLSALVVLAKRGSRKNG